MKKILVAVVAVVVLAGGYLAAAHLSGGAFPTLGLPLGGQRAVLRRLATSFLEDIQFKDFKRAASYHEPAKQASVDIPFLIWRLFAVKPEALDIMRHEIVFAEIDSTNLRGRVKSRVQFKELVRGDIRTQELMLYYERAQPGAPWHMKLEDSLRQLDAEKGKKT
ncbi:MAG TPA: hypothetical protein VGQ83_36195 [Polyangia bacterium]|jgi:hypothetical protein